MNRRLTPLRIVVALALAFPILLWLDEPTFPHVRDALERVQKWKLSFSFFRHYGGLWATFLAVALGWRLAPSRRSYLPLLLLGSLLAGGASEVLKPLIGRNRPNYTEGLTEFRWSDPPPPPRRKFSASLPSGHSTVAFANAYGMSAAFPPARGIFYGLAVLAALSRVEEGEHFVSDIHAGAIVGTVVPWLVFLYAPGLGAGLRRRFGPDRGVQA